MLFLLFEGTKFGVKYTNKRNLVLPAVAFGPVTNDAIKKIVTAYSELLLFAVIKWYANIDR